MTQQSLDPTPQRGSLYSNTTTPYLPVGKDFWVFCGLLLVANIGLLSGSPNPDWIYFPAEVQAGEWWRLFSHPFVHVGIYHWLFDGSAFLSLYILLSTPIFGRLGVVFGSAIGSLVAAQLGATDLDSTGFCGLSGICHGLLAVVLISILQAQDETSAMRLGAGFLLVILASKCLFEAITNQIPWLSLYGGEVGNPIAICHLGGFLGGLFFFILSKKWSQNNIPFLLVFLLGFGVTKTVL